MKKTSILLMLLLAVITFVSCSNDDSKDGPAKAGNAKSWKMYDGDFITPEDVIVSDNDTTNINVSKAYITKLKGKEQVAEGDIISLFTHGHLAYLQVSHVADNGNYMSIDVKKVSLTEVLGVLNINMSNVQLSTDIYFDQSLPKRVNNGGQADADGLINSKAYIETDAQGNTVIHPMAVLTPAFEAGANGEMGAVIPGAFAGCYVGQADNIEVANGWFSSVLNVLSNVSKVVITPVKIVTDAVKCAVDCGEILAKLAVGGSVNKDYRIIDFEHKFTGHRWDLTEGKAASVNDFDFNTMNKPRYTKAQWKDSVMTKAYVTLNGHVKANAGMRMILDFKPAKIEKFELDAYALFDLDANILFEIGKKIQITRPLSLHRFTPQKIMFDIGPVPVVIVVYPEIILNNQVSGEVLAYMDFDAKAYFNYDAGIQFIPEFKPVVNDTICKPFELEFNKLGVKGEVTASMGPYFRLSCELYGIAGPVLDFGFSANFKANADVFKEKDKDWDADGKITVTINWGEMRGSGAIGFPPLKDVSEWLYEKLSFQTKNLIDPPFVIYRQPIFEYPKENK